MGHLNHNNEPALFRSYWAHPRIRISGHPQRLRRASMVRAKGFEPLTPSFVVRYSIQLS